MDVNLDILDLSQKKLKKLQKPSSNEAQVTTLILDNNELQRLDNIDSFTKVQKLSAVRNQLLRMYGVCRLYLLHTLNLANNGILTIEGIKDLVNLRCLCLAGNSIKTIEHLNTNTKLEHLDLSENSITHITDISFLKNLKELLLHDNKIGHLRSCDRFLPTNLTTLTLAFNSIGDLNEISQLSHLTNLNSISFANNPCVSMTGNVIGFDYRPFIVNWCMNVRVIDGYIVDAIESLRAEWLYSQGRGRHFRVGDQQELAQYLASVCPLSGETLETEEDRKLRIILSKAQHHQQQLRDQESNPEVVTSSPATKKKFQTKNSPKLLSSRLGSHSKSPERMSTSCYSTNAIINSPLMSKSLDSSILRQNFNKSTDSIDEHYVFEKRLEDDVTSPLQALSKLVPVPESLMSPDYRPSLLINRMNTALVMPSSNQTISTMQNRSPKLSRIATPKSKLIQNKKSATPGQLSKIQNINNEDESGVCPTKLQTIQIKAEEKRSQRDIEIQSNGSAGEQNIQKNSEICTNTNQEIIEQAAVIIQKMWRGYFTRNKNKNVQELYKNLQSQRAGEYIKKLTTDMESTKIALESERRIQMLQMQAINALWKKVSTMQSDSVHCSISDVPAIDNSEIIKDLAHTCNMLQTQIQQLQDSMHDMVRFMSALNQMPGSKTHFKETAIATQTEISAVHTPQGDGAKMFPFLKYTRPSSLPLPVHHKNKQVINQELTQFAGSLVDDVIKTVSETADCAENTNLDITQIQPEKLDS